MIMTELSTVEKMVKESIIRTEHCAQQEFEPCQVEWFMKAYAEFYARLCLEIACEQARVEEINKSVEEGEFTDIYQMKIIGTNKEHIIQVHKPSIMNVKLPDHDKI